MCGVICTGNGRGLEGRGSGAADAIDRTVARGGAMSRCDPVANERRRGLAYKYQFDEDGDRMREWSLPGAGSCVCEKRETREPNCGISYGSYIGFARVNVPEISGGCNQ